MVMVDSLIFDVGNGFDLNAFYTDYLEGASSNFFDLLS